MTAYRYASHAGLVLSFIAYFILLVIAPLTCVYAWSIIFIVASPATTARRFSILCFRDTQQVQAPPKIILYPFLHKASLANLRHIVTACVSDSNRV